MYQRSEAMPFVMVTTMAVLDAVLDIVATICATTICAATIGCHQDC